MRLDKFTTKFQEALSDAQSIALGNDNAYIEPVHLLVAMLKQDDGPKALLQRAGANVPGLLAAAERYAWSQGAVRVSLNVAHGNAPGQALYGARGWIRDEQFHAYRRLPDRR